MCISHAIKKYVFQSHMVNDTCYFYRLSWRMPLQPGLEEICSFLIKFYPILLMFYRLISLKKKFIN
jgi:hypothetical protein